MNQIMIDGKKIIKSFGEGQEQVVVLNQVDIQIEAGQFVAIMGPSGSGKSTLLYAISGLDTLDSGTVVFNQLPLNQLKADQLANLRRKQMGFIFQQPTFLRNLSLIDNIILPSLTKRKETDALEKRAEELMRMVGIHPLKDRKITQVSGGQLQRAGICRALMGQPKIIFGDEPTGALNSKAAQEIMAILLKINQAGTTVVIVTHDAKVAAQSEKVLFMEDGQITTKIYLGTYQHERLEARIEAINERMLAAEI